MSCLTYVSHKYSKKSRAPKLLIGTRRKVMSNSLMSSMNTYGGNSPETESKSAIAFHQPVVVGKSKNNHWVGFELISPT